MKAFEPTPCRGAGNALRCVTPALRSVALLAMVLLAGCHRQPQIAPTNRHLIESLRTAIAAHRGDWLETTAKQIEADHGKGSVKDDEYATLLAVVAAGRAGAWADAQARLESLSSAQQPTAEDLERLKPGQRGPS